MPCPIIKATMGQHIRHSMDHVERAVVCAQHHHRQEGEGEQRSVIHYDLRERDTADEHDWMAADSRIHRVSAMLEDLSKANGILVLNRPVDASFMLSGDSNTEYCLPSTIARELGFAAHHAIHHLAMVKIIATNPAIGALKDSDLPADFGRAPSTVNFDHTIVKQV